MVWFSLCLFEVWTDLLNMIGAPRFEVFFCGLLKPEATTSASVSVTGIENCLWIGNQWSSLSMQKCLVLAVDYIWVPVNFSEVHLIQLSIALRCVWNSAGEELITGQTGNIRLGWRLQLGRDLPTSTYPDMYTLYKHWKSCKYAHGKRQGPTTHSYSWYLVLLTNIRSRYTQSSLQKSHHAHFLLHFFLSPNHQLETSNSFTLLAALHCANYTDSLFTVHYLCLFSGARE